MLAEVSGRFEWDMPRSGGPAEVGQASACALAAADRRSALFVRSHLEAFSTPPCCHGWPSCCPQLKSGPVGTCGSDVDFSSLRNNRLSFLISHDGWTDSETFQTSGLRGEFPSGRGSKCRKVPGLNPPVGQGLSCVELQLLSGCSCLLSRSKDVIGG